MSKRIPTHILRDDCIERVIAAWIPGKFIEMGAGTGITTEIFVKRKYIGSCYDLSAEDRILLKYNLSGYSDKVKVLENLLNLTPASFDYLFAFDVIEHIEDDKKSMIEWAGLLKQGGKVLISVPAHRRKFGKSDQLMGHFRRYEKDEITALLNEAGFSNIRIMSYGFPLINITTPVINMLYSLLKTEKFDYSALTQSERTLKSGFLKPGLVCKLLFPFNNITMFPFKLIQRLFFRYDIGVEYLAYGIKTGK